jgi:hypothetical protein
VRIQLLSAWDRVVWPSERRTIVQRYADAPATVLLVPTLPAFAASKTSTWADRKGARDLWDLGALSELGAIDRKAAHLYPAMGPPIIRRRRDYSRPRRPTPYGNPSWPGKAASRSPRDRRSMPCGPGTRPSRL